MNWARRKSEESLPFRDNLCDAQVLEMKRTMPDIIDVRINIETPFVCVSPGNMRIQHTSATLQLLSRSSISSSRPIN